MVQLGVASQCELSVSDEPEPKSEPVKRTGVSVSGTCACAEALNKMSEHYEKLMSVLEMPDKMSTCEVEVWNYYFIKKKLTDVCALNESELECTDVVCHKIETAPVRPPPSCYIPMVHREVIRQIGICMVGA